MRLLLAEDERALSNALTAILERNNYSVDAVYDGEAALAYLKADNYDGVILDIMMPKVDGITVLRELRNSGNRIPVLLLTAKSEIDDKVEGLDSGANDYLTKPFRVAELRARVAAHLRRQQRTPHTRLRRGSLDFDLGEKTIYFQGKPLKLTRSEYAICEHLAMRPGQIFSKEQIYEAAFV